MLPSSVGCDAVLPSSRPPSALRIRQRSMNPSSVPEKSNVSTLRIPPVHDRPSRPSSKRLSTELDELLKWEGFSGSDFSANDSLFGHDGAFAFPDFGDDSNAALDEYDAAFEEEFGDVAGYSRLSDILASARQKLDALEDNLKGARHSLYLAPALPSPSTTSLRSTTSSETSPSFSAISDEESISGSRALRITSAPIGLLGNVDVSRTNLGHGRFYSETSVHSTQALEHSLVQDRRPLPNSSSNAEPDTEPDSSREDDIPALWSLARHSRTTSAAGTNPCTLENPASGLGISSENVRIDSPATQPDQPNLDSLPRASQSMHIISPPEDPRRLSTASAQSNVTARGPSNPSSTIILPQQTVIKELVAVKHAPSYSPSITSTVTETESFASGWDSESDDSDTEELLHDEFEGTWPMPPASIGIKAATPATIQIPAHHTAPATKELRPILKNSSALSSSSSDDGVATPRGRQTSHDSTKPVKPHPKHHQQRVSSPTIDTQSSTSTSPPEPTRQRQDSAISSPRDNQQPSKPQSTSSPTTLTTSLSSSTTPAQTPPRTSRPAAQVDSKTLNAADQALAFALAESMHDACLRLRDGSDAEKQMWRDRIERARKVLSGEF